MEEKEGIYFCPFCHKGRIIASESAAADVSSICPVCKNRFIADLGKKRCYRPKDYKDLMKTETFDITFHCPTKGCRGKVMTDAVADVYVSVRCAKCRSYFIADLYRQMVSKSAAKTS